MKKQELVIQAGRVEGQYWNDIWRYRELLYFLAWRDILVRYKETVIGVAWSVVRPLLMILVFTVIFGRIAKLSSDSIPYPLLVFSGMIPWQFFANALSESSSSLLNNSGMLTKIYFPRLLIPMSSVAVSLVDLVISIIILAVVMLYYGFCPDWRVLTLPLFAAMGIVLATATGLWLSALSVRFRDVRQIVPFIVQFGLYISPVGFKSTIVPEEWQRIYALNPMVAVINGFRWALLRGNQALNLADFATSFIVIILLLVSGIWYFRKTERTFADII